LSFVRAYFYLLMPVFILGIFLSLAVDLPFGIIGIILATIIFCTVPAALIAWISEKTGSVASILYTGYRQSNKRDQYSGHLTRARVLRTEKNYEQALASIDEFLQNIPEDIEALFLKAQTLTDCKKDSEVAKHCLFSILKKTPPDNSYHRWSKELMKKASDFHIPT
jgi:tetratricopeptide (TPR) repeat protein